MRDTMSNQFTSYIIEGYDALKSNQTNHTIQLWQKGYQLLSDELQNEKISFLQLGNFFGFQPSISKWLKDFVDLYMKNRQYDEVILLSQNILDLFIDNKYVHDFRISIGQALFSKGDIQQAYQHFDQLLKKYPNELELIYAYLSCLKDDDPNKAKAIILKYVPLTLEYNKSSEALFKLSKDILEALHDTDLVRQYQNVNKTQSEFGKRKPVCKKVTVGRNDPCPCGSGKKYKKCCGR